MEIAFHVGAHNTEADLLLNCLRHNAGYLAREGTIVPAGEAYRPVIGDAVRKLRGESADPDEEEAILELILKGMNGRRLVMSSENFICVPQRVFDEGALYAKIAHKSVWLRNVFPSQQVSFFMAVRNPAAFVPALFLRRKQGSFEEYLGSIALEKVCWSDTVAALAEAVPDCQITVWCTEDSPLIWPEVMAAVAGVDSTTQLERSDVHLRSIMKPEGLARLHEYLQARPDLATAQRRWATIAFLDKYSSEDAMEESFDLPDWTQDRIEVLTEAYETDMEKLAELPGVTFLQP
ncbi:hypothetical protein [Tropicimonas sp. S265A]|uniref:hypothetical protein n=1 Tax=Tropicimonas sp. S265A TaxID=3415134 RepID=UPI003C7DD40A